MRFAFIHEHRHEWPIERLCQVLRVSARGCRAWTSRPACQCQRTDLKVLAHIREHYALSNSSYGRPRMTMELREAGLDVGERRVGRLMKDNGNSLIADGTGGRAPPLSGGITPLCLFRNANVMTEQGMHQCITYGVACRSGTA